MKGKITLKNTLLPRGENKRLVEKFNRFWTNYINKEIKRKFLWVVYHNCPKIKDFRKKWGVPDSGFKTENEGRPWLDAQPCLTEKAMRGMTYWEKITPYESWGLILKEKASSDRAINSRRRRGEKSTFVGKFQEAAEELARDIGMDNSWHEQFEDYLLFGTEEMRSIKDAGVKVSKKLKSYGPTRPVKGSVVLEFGPNTRLRDIQFVWKDQIEPIKKSLPGYIKLSPNTKPKEPSENCSSQSLSRLLLKK